MFAVQLSLRSLVQSHRLAGRTRGHRTVLPAGRETVPAAEPSKQVLLELWCGFGEEFLSKEAKQRRRNSVGWSSPSRLRERCKTDHRRPAVCLREELLTERRRSIGEHASLPGGECEIVRPRLDYTPVNLGLALSPTTDAAIYHQEPYAHAVAELVNKGVREGVQTDEGGSRRLRRSRRRCRLAGTRKRQRARGPDAQDSTTFERPARPRSSALALRFRTRRPSPSRARLGPSRTLSAVYQQSGGSAPPTAGAGSSSRTRPGR